MDEPDHAAISPDGQMASRRAVATHLRYWTACLDARCRRHRRCVGAVDRCESIFWPVVPEILKVRLRALAKADSEGRSRAQSLRAADEAMRVFRQYEAWRAARAATSAGTTAGLEHGAQSARNGGPDE
jgi:hypothetical protein